MARERKEGAIEALTKAFQAIEEHRIGFAEALDVLEPVT
jgi:hypothetical protein